MYHIKVKQKRIQKGPCKGETKRRKECAGKGETEKGKRKLILR